MDSNRLSRTVEQRLGQCTESAGFSSIGTSRGWQPAACARALLDTVCEPDDWSEAPASLLDAPPETTITLGDS